MAHAQARRSQRGSLASTKSCKEAGKCRRTEIGCTRNSQSTVLIGLDRVIGVRRSLKRIVIDFVVRLSFTERILPLSVDHFTQNGNVKNISHIDATGAEVNEGEKDVTQKPAPKVSQENFELELGKLAENTVEKVETDEQKREDEYQLFQLPREKSCLCQAWWLLIWPIHLVYWLTIPNCERGRFKNLFPVTFLMCIIWIGSLSYLVAWMITIVG